MQLNSVIDSALTLNEQKRASTIANSGLKITPSSFREFRDRFIRFRYFAIELRAPWDSKLTADRRTE